MNVVLVSTYEMGRQPFGLASPAAWLKAARHDVACLDLAVQPLDEAIVARADLIAFYVPMHTATRIAAGVVERVRAINPRAHLCFYGLYAPVNEAYLHRLGAGTILGGEFEEGLVTLAERLSGGGAGTPAGTPELPVISLGRQRFLVPDRGGLPDLTRYAHLVLGPETTRTVGYTEATRGCKHLCRHCPIVPVYGGRFRVVQRDVVLADIARQVDAGAAHITFGDPDFFNAPRHAIAVVTALHERFPQLSYDATIKIEHLVKHAGYVPLLRDTGCLFVTSAVESFDNHILDIFDKQHSKADIFLVLSVFREAGLPLVPTFVAFTPWTTLKGYRDFLADIADLGLIDSVAPIQYGIRLLIPAGSKLLELATTRDVIREFDESALCYRWTHPDPRMDRLQLEVMALVEQRQRQGDTRREVFAQVWRLAHAAYADSGGGRPVRPEGFWDLPDRATIPYLSEPWFC